MITTKLHPITQGQIDAAGKQPAAVYIFAGMGGLGKAATAHELAEQLTEGDATSIIRLQPAEGKKRLGITEVHQLIHDLQLKSFLPESRRVVMIEHADTLSSEAANALLRILEEPPEQVVFILIARTVADLLPTIRSRSVLIRFLPTGEGVATQPDSELRQLAAEFLAGSITRRFAIARQIHDQTTHAEFLQALYDQAKVQRQPAIAARLMIIERALAHNVSSRLGFETLAMELGQQDVAS